MAMEPEERDASQREDDRQVHRRLALPLLIPAIVFLFALLVIYGLSRIYLELNDFEVGEVSMATPLALGVALFILLGAWYLANLPRITRMHIASVFALSAALLTAGGIWAAVHEGEEIESAVAPPAEDG
ncbi:MAG: hypothetical protein Q8S13_12715, partial [Dehalococcoidia bacterium]|nr:hypothetical protein [Dehalococcoidia bacterium]